MLTDDAVSPAQLIAQYDAAPVDTDDYEEANLLVHLETDGADDGGGGGGVDDAPKAALKPYTLNPKPQTLNPKCCALNLEP